MNKITRLSNVLIEKKPSKIENGAFTIPVKFLGQYVSSKAMRAYGAKQCLNYVNKKTGQNPVRNIISQPKLKRNSATTSGPLRTILDYREKNQIINKRHGKSVQPWPSEVQSKALLEMRVLQPSMPLVEVTKFSSIKPSNNLQKKEEKSGKHTGSSQKRARSDYRTVDKVKKTDNTATLDSQLDQACESRESNPKQLEEVTSAQVHTAELDQAQESKKPELKSDDYTRQSALNALVHSFSGLINKTQKPEIAATGKRFISVNAKDMNKKSSQEVEKCEPKEGDARPVEGDPKGCGRDKSHLRRKITCSGCVAVLDEEKENKAKAAVNCLADKRGKCICVNKEPGPNDPPIDTPYWLGKNQGVSRCNKPREEVRKKCRRAMPCDVNRKEFHTFNAVNLLETNTENQFNVRKLLNQHLS